MNMQMCYWLKTSNLVSVCAFEGSMDGRFVRWRWGVLYLFVILVEIVSAQSSIQPAGLCGGGQSGGRAKPQSSNTRYFKNAKAIENHKYISEKDLSHTRPPNLGFKIRIWYTTGSADIMSDPVVERRLRKVIRQTSEYFSALVGVYKHNQTSTHRVWLTCLNDSVLNETQGRYINVTGYDYHLIVDAGNSKYCKTGVGWAYRTCAPAYHSRPGLSTASARNLVGLIYLCQNKLEAGAMEDGFLFSTVKHETLHSLGVSSDKLYDNWATRTTRQIVWETGYGNFNQTQVYHTHPLVRDAARVHFNCSTLDGAPLETSGGNGTHHSHFDMRVFGPILMSGIISRKTYLSNITIAMLRSLLWHTSANTAEEWYPWINISMREDAWYGRNAGCDFVERSCKATIDKQPLAYKTPRTSSFPFCSAANLKAFKKVLDKDKTATMMGTCSPDRLSVLVCQVNANIVVDEENKSTLYYSDTSINRIRGNNPLLEYCPAFTDATGTTKDTYCKNEHSKPSGADNTGGEVFGGHSACFEQWEPFTKVSCNKAASMRLLAGGGRNVEGTYSGAGCYKYKCKHGRLLIEAAGEYKDYGYKVCWSAGTRIDLRRMIDKETFVHGEMICPTCATLCSECAPPVDDIHPRDVLQPACYLASHAHTSAHYTQLYILSTLVLTFVFCKYYS